MTLSPIAHGHFSVSRFFRQTPAKVFAAYTDQAVKRRWFAEGEDFEVENYVLDFRVGGRESCAFRPTGGPPMTMDAVYHEIVENRRIVIAYDMTLAGKILSLSISSTEFEADGGGTTLTYTEHGIYYGDPAAVAGREEGSRQLLASLAKELGR